MGGAVLALLVALGNAYVLLSGGDSTSEVADVPHAEVAIVPGALVQPDGKMSAMLADRVGRPRRSGMPGKVEKILVSGDHGTWNYDEPDTMRKALVRDGVPPRDIFEDHAGFDTWATMVRARASSASTTRSSSPRASTCRGRSTWPTRPGIDATGLTADLHHWGYQGRRARSARSSRGSRRSPTSSSTRRRWPARDPDRHHDGRESWGPEPPPGTPPAGHPEYETRSVHSCARWTHKSTLGS